MKLFRAFRGLQSIGWYCVLQRSKSVEADDVNNGEWKDSEEASLSANTYGANSEDIFFDAL